MSTGEGNENGWSRWYLLVEAGQFSIKRSKVEGGKTKWQRHPRKLYSHLTLRPQLEAYLDRINFRYLQELKKYKEAYDFKHRFISEQLVEDFFEDLVTDIPTEKAAQYLLKLLKRNLHWFIVQNKSPDPTEWKALERTWGQALIGNHRKDSLSLQEDRKNPDTIKKQKQIMNRFLQYLHRRFPKEVSLIQLEPLSKAQLRLYKAEYARKFPVGQFISDADWKVIEKKLSDRILPFVQLGYYYGLRRNEILAITTEDVFEDSLSISKQLKSLPETGPVYSPLKSREARQTPHWFITASQVYKILEKLPPLVHPDTFSDLFFAEMKRLGFSYQLHDLRRTFITRAFRAGKLPRDIMLAAGHADLATTMRYAQDDRELSKKKFKPVS